MKQPDEVELQRRYYAETAAQYDGMHLEGDEEHVLALAVLVGALDYLKVSSVLDVGSGTGRVLQYVKRMRPGLRVVGVEPVRELREVGHARGLSEEELVDGDATRLPFAAGEFDLVCAFAVLHHVRRPEVLVGEMLRVAGRAVFISDANNFGQGSLPARLVKQALNLVGLWRLADWVKTRGRGYTVSEGDGLAYSYSVFDSYRQVEAACAGVHVMNMKGGGMNPYATASHVALLGIKG